MMDEYKGLKIILKAKEDKIKIRRFDMIKKLITVFIVLISFISCAQDKEKTFSYTIGDPEQVTVKYINKSIKLMK